MIYFTLEGSFFSTPDDTGESVPLEGMSVRFTPMVERGDLLANDTNLLLPAYITTVVDGAGDIAVRLLASDPEFDLVDPLSYRISFPRFTLNGKHYAIEPWTFTAPSTDTVINLADVTPGTGVVAAGVRRGFTGGAHLTEDGKIYFDIEGGGTTTPVLLGVVDFSSIDGGDAFGTGDGEIDGGSA